MNFEIFFLIPGKRVESCKYVYV